MARRTLHLLTPLFLLTACGGPSNEDKQPRHALPQPPPVVESVTPTTADDPVQPESAPTDDGAYWQVDEGEAETVLVAVVRSGRGSQTHEAPLRRCPAGEWPGTFVSGSMGIGHGTSPNGKRFAVYDSFAVTGDPGPGVTLRLSSDRSGPTGADHKSRGFRHRLTVPVDQPGEHRLSEDATLIVSFRAPKRVPHAEPGWEQELAREREAPATAPLPAQSAP